MEYWRIKIKDEESKRTRKENEGKELKKKIPKDKAANIIIKEMIFSQLKNKSIEDLLKLYRRLVIIFNPILNSGDITKQFTDFSKDELLTKLNNTKTN